MFNLSKIFEGVQNKTREERLICLWEIGENIELITQYKIDGWRICWYSLWIVHRSKHIRTMCLYLTICDPCSWLEEHVKWGFILHEAGINLESGRLGWSHKTKLNWRSLKGRSAAKAWSKISKWHDCTVDLLSLQHIGVYD